MPTDEELALGIKHGKTADLITLVDRHYDSLIGYLYRLTGGDRMLSEDLVQEAFLNALRGIHSYEYPRPFKPWLYAIATNLARNHSRSADSRHTISADEDLLHNLDDLRTTPEATLLADAETQALLAALNHLPDHQREVILLRYSEELSLAEIADILNIPIGTVKSRLSLGLRRLRDLMED